MCEIILNKDDYGFVLINKICNQNQPTLKHLKERISNLTDIRLKKTIILRFDLRWTPSKPASMQGKDLRFGLRFFGNQKSNIC